MKKAITSILIGTALLSLALSLAAAHPDAARPEGVQSDAWIPLTADAGFVIAGGGSSTTKLGLGPSLSGYLMARRDGKWIRLELEAAGRMVPTN
jgi:hypothetical protein